MGRSRFLIIAFISFLAVVGEGILKKVLALLLCGLLGFNSMVCFVDWDYGRVNAARPNLEESSIAVTPQGQSEKETGIKSISKWWATAGEDKLIDTTLRIEIEEKGKYQLNINIGGAGLVSSKWGLTRQSEAILKSLESNKIIEEARFGISGEFTGKVEFSQELIPGNYEVKITNIEVPKKPIVERIDFILNQKIRDFGAGNAPYEGEELKSKLTTLFIADRSEPNLDQSQIDELINKYAPILYFDRGRICGDLDDERYTVPLDVKYSWGEHPAMVKDKLLITGDIKQTFQVYNQNYEHKPNENKNGIKAVYQDKSKGMIYAAVAENETEIAINYYFHYPISNWKEYNGYNNHVGDWEGITVFLDKNNLNDPEKEAAQRVVFSQHVAVAGFSGGYTVPWEFVDKEESRPKVYVGLGGHASFPFPGITQWINPEFIKYAAIKTGKTATAILSAKKYFALVRWITQLATDLRQKNDDVPQVFNIELHKGDRELGPFKPNNNQVHYLKRGSNLSLGNEDDWLLYPGKWGESRNYPKQWEQPGGEPPRGPIFQDVDVLNLKEISGVGDRWTDPWKWSEDFKTLKKAEKADDYYKNILVEKTENRNSIGIEIEPFGIVRALSGTQKNYSFSDGLKSGSSFIYDAQFLDRVVRSLLDGYDINYQGLEPGKVGFARLGNDLFIDLNRNGTIEMVDENYSDAPQDMMIVDFGTNNLDRDSVLSSMYIDNWTANGSICPPAQPEPKPELEGVSGKIFGDPHLITFDRRRLSFQAVGEFIQAKSSSGNFEVQGRYKQVGRNASLADAVAVKLGRDRVGVYARQNPPLWVNGAPTNIGDELLVLDGGGQIYRSGSTYVIISPTGEGVKARRVSAGGGSLTVEVVMPETRRGQVAGLLGNFNGDSSDDIQTRSGEVLPRNPNYEQLYKVFGNSWRISQEESLFDYAPGQTTATFTDLSFPNKIVRTRDFASNRRAAAERTCREAGVREPELLEACIFDILVTEDNRFARVSANVEETLTSDIEATPDERQDPTSDRAIPNEQQDPISYADFSEVRTLTGHRYSVNSVAISPDGQTIVSGSHDGTVKVWDLKTGSLKATLTGHNEPVNAVAISSDGQAIVSGGGAGIYRTDNTIRVWNLKTGSLQSTLTGHKSGVSSVAISSDGQTIVSGSLDKSVKVWDLATGSLKATLTGHSGLVHAVAISPDGKTIVSSSYDESIKVWDLVTGSLKATLTGHTHRINSVAISSDGKTIISGSLDGNIKAWDLLTGNLKATMTLLRQVDSVAISSDGNTIVSGILHNIRVWDLATGNLKATLTGHRDRVSSVAISPDGRTIVSGSKDDTIKVWQAVSTSASQPTAPANPINSAPEIPIDFCVKSATWTRHSESEQINFLRRGPHAVRYERASDEQLLNIDLWKNDFLVYKGYYGASGAADNVRVSGIWSLRDPKAFTDGVRGFGECNSDFVTQPLIQIWAFSHDLKKVQWMGDRYLMTVKPTGQGFQIFQFPRQGDDLLRKVNPNERSQNISPSEAPPIQIVDETGSTISICRENPRRTRMLCP